MIYSLIVMFIVVVSLILIESIHVIIITIIFIMVYVGFHLFFFIAYDQMSLL
jgi:hypothetical protein